ncbi:hypothetical protein JMUB7504_27610 [Staphylococcus aureus]
MGVKGVSPPLPKEQVPKSTASAHPATPANGDQYTLRTPDPLIKSLMLCQLR